MTGQAPFLSLCMIVRDSAATLPACLESIRRWVDELIVVDTGSVDDTRDIARFFDARVYEFPWIDDFAAARNESLRFAHGSWIFWMDSDDTIDEQNGRMLRELAKGAHSDETLGYVLQVHCPGSGLDELDVTVVDHVKLFRSHPGIRFEGRIHEQVLMPIRRLGGQVRFTNIFVRHSGSDQSPAGRRRKFERDLRILRKDLEERPDHGFVLFNLGMTHADAGNYQQALDYLFRSLVVSTPSESHVCKVYALVVNCCAQLGQREEAVRQCEKGLQLYPLDPELTFRKGMLLHDMGRLEASVGSYRAALAPRTERHFASIDRGIVGFKARHNLALVYREMGRSDMAELQWREAIDEAPRFVPGRRELVENLLAERKYVTAEVEIDKMLRDDGLRCLGLVLQAKLAVARGDPEAARASLETARSDFSDQSEPHQALCQLLFESGRLSEAEAALRDLAARFPDGAVHYNLGLVHQMMNNHAAAVEAFRESIRLRPVQFSTHLRLGHSLWAMAQYEEAITVWEQAQRLAPHDRSIRAAIVMARRQIGAGQQAMNPQNWVLNC